MNCDTTGLGCLNNRYHDPVLGSFLSVDPLVQTTGQPYIYGSGNPVTYSDASGLCAVRTPTGSIYDDGLGPCPGGKHYDDGPCANAHTWTDSFCSGSHPEPPEPYEDNRASWFPNPIGVFVDEVEGVLAEVEDGWHQLIDPATCGLQGFNPATGGFGNCSRDQIERREVYEETGASVCEASRTPIVGSVIPEANRESVAWFIAAEWSQETAKHAAKGGLTAVGSAAKAGSGVSAGATAVDALCRWSTP